MSKLESTPGSPMPSPDGTPPQPVRRGPERFHASAGETGRQGGGAFGAGLALLLLVVGVPVVLLLFGQAPPIPTGWPSRDSLSQPLDSGAIMAVLRIVVWLAWLQFTVCVLVEAVSALRGRGLPSAVPLSGPTQHFARLLVGALLVGGAVAGTGGTAVAASVPTAADTPATTQVHHAADRANATDRASSQGQADEATGDAVELDHAGVPSSMTDVIGKKVYVVKPPQGHYHDNLWDIAEKHLGNGRRWHEIYNLNHGRVQPDGEELVLGRLIQPGWVLIMPDDATGLQRVHEVPAQEQSTPANAAEAASSGATAGAQGSDLGATGQEAGPAVQQDGGLARDLAYGGLMSAGLLGALLALRRRRRTTEPDPEALEAEVALRVGADADRALRLDEALRGLGQRCRDEQVPLPSVFAALVDDDRIDLLLAPASGAAPTPWTVEQSGRVWRLSAEEEVADSSGHAPYPGLVCLGRQVDGTDVLVDLEAVGGVVSVNGDARVAHEVISALAAQLVTTLWSDDQRVAGVDLSEALVGVGDERLTLTEDLSGTLSELEASRPERAASDVLSGRLARRPGLVPVYVAVGTEPGAELAERLVGLTASGDRGFGAIVAGEVFGTRWQLHVDENGTLEVPLLDLQVEAVRLSERSAGQLEQLFAAAQTPEPASSDGRLRIGRPARPGDDGQWTSARVRVGVLGPVEVRAQGSLDPTRVPLATEIAAYLALQPAPVHPSVLGAAIWPRGVTTDVREATVERVREWLGQAEDGSWLLRADAEGRLSLAEDVAVDWDALCQLAVRAREAASAREEAELLRRALHLVRGELLAAHPTGRYSWLARTGLEARVPDAVVGIANRLAQLCHDNRDPSGAAAAVEAGLRLAPGSQLLWRELVRDEFERDGTGAAAEAVGRMADELAARGCDIEPETDALVEELLPTTMERSG